MPKVGQLNFSTLYQIKADFSLQAMGSVGGTHPYPKTYKTSLKQMAVPD